jgi:hypothetical protein
MGKIIIGISGTRQGLTDIQLKKVENILIKLQSKYEDMEMHHGDCIGSDQQIHEMVVEKNLVQSIVIHPPKNAALRSFCENCFNDTIIIKQEFEKDYLDRNKDIVAISELMIITPKENDEIVKSGTWMSYRTSKKLNKKTLLIKPNGQQEIWPHEGLANKMRKKIKKQ